MKAAILLALAMFVSQFIALKSVMRMNGNGDDENLQGKWWLFKNIKLKVNSNEATETWKEQDSSESSKMIAAQDITTTTTTATATMITPSTNGAQTISIGNGSKQIPIEGDMNPEGGDPYCPPTTSIQMLNGTTFQSLTFESKHSVLRPKVQNGDEYYVDSGHDTKGMSVLDLGNGRYQIQNVTTSPVRIWLQYTCGDGKLSPPSKKEWTDGRAINQEFWRNITGMLKEPPIQPPTTSSLSLSSHVEIVGVGDSLMRQLLLRDDRSPRHANTRYALVHAPLLPSTVVSYFLRSLNRLWAARPFTRDTIIFLGSGVWDVLGNHYDPQFASHGKTLQQLLNTVHERYPMAKIAWKGMTAMHVHTVRYKNRKKCLNRAKYMSSSRASMLNQLQWDLVANTSALFLPMYQATLTEVRHLRENDGRHYNETMNDQLWQDVVDMVTKNA